MMAFVDSNPWDILLPYIEALTPAQLGRLGELVSRPIIDWYLWIDESGVVHYAGEE